MDLHEFAPVGGRATSGRDGRRLEWFAEVGYAIWSGAGVTLIALIGWLAFGEKLDPPAVLGMSLIVASVVVLNLFSKVASH